MRGALEHPVVPDSASVGPDLVDESGGRFGDRYVLRSRLGSGCSSNVYAVRDQISGGNAACKLAQRRPKLRWSQLQVRPPRACPSSHTRTSAYAPLTPRAQRHFEHEVKLLRMCVHPHIIGCRGLYMGSEDLAIVLDLMPGGDCQQLLKRHGALAEPAVHTIMEQLFDALACVHAQGILHRDVKLENILVTTAISPQIKVRHAATHSTTHTHAHTHTRTHTGAAA
jgi:serine/threonine protein kinase